MESKPSKLPSVLIGGLTIGILGTSYLGFINILCCAGVILGGMVAVWHYTNEHELTIQGGEGAVLGLLAGIAGVVVGLVLDQVVGFIGLPNAQEVQQQIQALFMGNQDMTAEQREMQEEMMAQWDTPAMKALGVGMALVINMIFGAIGGAIGAAVFKKGEAPDPIDSL